MTVTVTAAPAATPQPAVLVDVTSSPSVTAPMKVYRVHDDGSRHRVIASSRVLIGGWSATDYHPPTNRLFSYVAAAEGEPESAPSADIYLPSVEAWMVHASRPDLSFPIMKIMAPMQPVTYSSSSAAFDILHDPTDQSPSLPVIRTDTTRSGATGKMTIKIATADLSSALEFFRSGGPVLLNGPWSADELGWMWFVAKDVTVTNPGGRLSYPMRHLDFDFRECRQPDVDVTPLSNWADVAEKGTWAAAAGAYADWRAMNLGIES